MRAGVVVLVAAALLAGACGDSGGSAVQRRAAVLAERCSEPAPRLLALARETVRTLANDSGIHASLAAVLRHVEQAAAAGRGRTSCRPFFAAYVTLRESVAPTRMAPNSRNPG